MTDQCYCDEGRAEREQTLTAPWRLRALRPMFSPVAATRDAAAGATNSPQHGCANGPLLGGADGPGMASGSSVVRDQSSEVQLLRAAPRSTTASTCSAEHDAPGRGGSSSSVGGETPSELATPVGLGGQGPALDTYPGSRGRVSGLTVHRGRHVAARAATDGESRLRGVSC